MKADLHSHSHYSRGEKITVEGLDSPAEMVRYAKKIGLGALAITDHNEFKAGKEAEKAGKKLGITIIKGEEIQAAGNKHILGLGMTEFIKPGHSVEETIDLIRQQGALAVAPHPFDLEGRGIRKKALDCDAVETFNAINLDRFSNWKAESFSKKHGIPGIAGSDAHCKEMLGYGVTEVDSANDAESILKAVAKGKVTPQCRYIPIGVIQYWSLKRFQGSYSQVLGYIHSHYSNPKRWMASGLLSLTKRSPGKIDYFFRGLGYLGIGTAIFYSGLKNAVIS